MWLTYGGVRVSLSGVGVVYVCRVRTSHHLQRLWGQGPISQSERNLVTTVYVKLYDPRAWRYGCFVNRAPVFDNVMSQNVRDLHNCSVVALGINTNLQLKRHDIIF